MEKYSIIKEGSYEVKRAYQYMDCRFDDGKIIVKPITDTGKTVILALYDGDKGNRFIEIQSEIYNGAEITFTPTQNYTLAKVMIWKSLDSLSSVCDYRTLKN